MLLDSVLYSAPWISSSIFRTKTLFQGRSKKERGPSLWTLCQGPHTMQKLVCGMHFLDPIVNRWRYVKPLLFREVLSDAHRKKRVFLRDGLRYWKWVRKKGTSKHHVKSAKPSRQYSVAAREALKCEYYKKDNSHQKQGCATEVVQIAGWVTVGILHPGM